MRPTIAHILATASLLLCLPAAAQQPTRMWQPATILEEGVAAHVAAVETDAGATRVTLVLPQGSTLALPASTIASDEDDRRHQLLRVDGAQPGNAVTATDSSRTIVLIFEPLPRPTRLFDIVLSPGQRWMGIHSGVRTLRLPASRPQFDGDAELPDSVADVLRANALTQLLDDDSLRATVQGRLPLFHDYVAWKWHLTPHAVFLLSRAHDRIAPEPEQPPTTKAATAEPRPLLRTLPRAPQPRRNIFQRIFGGKSQPSTSGKTPRRTSHPLSPFEQKMLQERRK